METTTNTGKFDAMGRLRVIQIPSNERICMTIGRTLACALLLTFSAQTSFAGQGGGMSGGGGGDLSPATDQEIKGEIESIWKDDLQYAFWSLRKHSDQVQDETLKRVFKKMFEYTLIQVGDVLPSSSRYDTDPYPIDAVLERTEFKIETAAPCVDPRTRKRRQAAVVRDDIRDMSRAGLHDLWQRRPYETKYATVCYSLPLLRGIPRAGLKDALISLSAHEATHLFKFDEPEAQAVEKFFGYTGRDLLVKTTARDRIREHGEAGLEFEVGRILGSPSPSDTVLCGDLGGLRMLALALRNDIQIANERVKQIPDAALNMSLGIGQALEDSLSFCGEVQMAFFGDPSITRLPVDRGPVPLGDRATLTKYLQAVLAQLRELATVLGSN